MAKSTGRGWHGDPEGHAAAARERDKFNWWPLLLIPLAFFLGIGVNQAMTSSTNQNNSQIQRGVGGGGTVPTCTVPSIAPSATPNRM